MADERAPHALKVSCRPGDSTFFELSKEASWDLHVHTCMTHDLILLASHALESRAGTSLNASRSDIGPAGTLYACHVHGIYMYTHCILSYTRLGT